MKDKITANCLPTSYPILIEDNNFKIIANCFPTSYPMFIDNSYRIIANCLPASYPNLIEDSYRMITNSLPTSCTTLVHFPQSCIQIETCHLICNAQKLAGFCMKCNTRLKYSKFVSKLNSYKQLNLFVDS